MDDVREATRRGKFGYETCSKDLYMPFIWRGDEKYCAEKIFTWNINRQKLDLEPNLNDFQYLKSYQLHHDEVKLLNEINVRHNDSMYPFTFNTEDALIKLKDACDIFQYVNDCIQKSKFGDQYQMIAGMIHIRLSKSNVIWPYVKRNGIQYIPVQVLNAPKTLCNTVILADIEVMYMKYLASILKMDITCEDSQMKCVALDEAVAHSFSDMNDSYVIDDNYWPTKMLSHENTNNNNLPDSMPSQTNIKATEQPEPNGQQHKEDPPKQMQTSQNKKASNIHSSLINETNI